MADFIASLAFAFAFAFALALALALPLAEALALPFAELFGLAFSLGSGSSAPVAGTLPGGAGGATTLEALLQAYWPNPLQLPQAP